MEEGESGISCQLSSRVSWFLLVERELGGAEFHFLVRILLRIDSEELSPLDASFNKYAVSFVLPLRVHHWRSRSYEPIGISCRQWPLVVRLDVTLVTMHVVSPSLLRMGHHLRPQPSSSRGISFPMCIAKRRPIRRSCSSGILGLCSMVIIPSNLLCLVELFA